MLKIILPILFAFFVLFILTLDVNSDYDTYIKMFADFDKFDNIFNYIYVIKDNTIAVYFINLITNYFDQDEITSTRILFFSQALIHSFVIFNLSGIKYGFILLFSDLQQIDLNQVRYGLALSFMTIASRRILINKEKRKAILSRIKNYILIVIGFFLHFQAIFLILVTYLSKIKLKYSIFLSSTIILTIPLFLSFTGITQRYINEVYDIEYKLSNSLVFYVLTIFLIIVWFSRIDKDRIQTIKYSKFRLEYGKKSLSKYLLPITIFIVGFFFISKSTAYQERIITGLYSALLYLVAIKLDLQKPRYSKNKQKPYLPYYLIIPFIILGIYRFIIIQGNVYRLFL